MSVWIWRGSRSIIAVQHVHAPGLIIISATYSVAAAQCRAVQSRRAVVLRGVCIGATHDRQNNTVTSTANCLWRYSSEGLTHDIGRPHCLFPGAALTENLFSAHLDQGVELIWRLVAARHLSGMYWQHSVLRDYCCSFATCVS